jgi:hypothetical protein
MALAPLIHLRALTLSMTAQQAFYTLVYRHLSVLDANVDNWIVSR